MSRAIAEEVKASVEAIHRAGLVSIVRRLKADEATRAALFELVDDPVVHLLLSIHEIVRPDPMTLANRVLAQVRPQLQSHGGDVAWCASRTAPRSSGSRARAMAARCRR